MTTQLSPFPVFRAWDNLGIPLVGGKLFTYIAGSTTKQATYTDSTGGSSNTNPVIFNFRGEANIWLDPTKTYKFVLAPSTDTDPPSNPIWSVDNIPGGFVLTAAAIGALIYPQTAAEIAASVTPTSFVYPEGDIRRYGAATGASDNSGPINSALAVSAQGGQPAYIPRGTWKITSTVACAGACSMRGDGQFSVIAPQVPNGSPVHGLTFTNQGTFNGERFFEKFAIVAANAGGNPLTGPSASYAIAAAMTAASGNQINGVVFRDIYISNFQWMVNVQGGFYRTTFTDCYGLNNSNGFNFVEQSIKVTLLNCMVIKSPVATHGDGTVALNCDQTGGVRPQDITANGCFFYGHDIGVSFGNVLYCALDNCDIDQTQTTCVSLTTVNGGCRIRNCWLDTNTQVAGATFGVQVNALGAANNDEIAIDANYIICTVGNVGSIGVTVGGNQKAVTITRNTIGSSSAPWANGLSITGAQCVAKYNSIYASTTAVSINSSATDVEIGPHVVQNGTPVAFTSLTPAGFTYYARGSFTLTLTGMTAGTTGTVNYVANGRTVTLSVASAGISGTSNATTMTGTGLPAALFPVTDQTVPFNVLDNGAGALGSGVIAAATGTITFKKDFNGTAFTAAGTKGLNGINATYAYL